MYTERSDIEFPLWRKKVDGSLLNRTGTVIPIWLYSVWNIDRIFKGVRSRNDSKSTVEIIFNGKKFTANVTSTHPKGRSAEVFRLFYDDSLQSELRDVFLMSYMRSIEGDLRRKTLELIQTQQKQDSVKTKVRTSAQSLESKVNIEEEIPFWEFLDIEFDQRAKSFRFTAHYKQKPQFEELFKRLTKSPALRTVSDEVEGKEKDRIHKQGWKPRSEYKFEIGAENIIYTLIDTQNKLIYVGQAKKLIYRFDRGHTEIKDWDYYKYNVLPISLEHHRITIERMIIRDLAALFANNQDIKTKNLSTYRLVNRMIDK